MKNIKGDKYMSNYLISHYKGLYRIKSEYDKKSNQFPRKLDETYEDIDCYIDCHNNIRIFYYGKSILQAYIPSKGRGHNIIRAIKSERGDDILFNIEETDSEVLFLFKAKHMKELEFILKPKTGGANISPFSSRNLPKNRDYRIPDKDLVLYKNIVEKIGQNRIIELSHTTNSYLKSLITKNNTWENIKADMSLKGLSGNKYIHSIGKWNEYIKYLERFYTQNYADDYNK